MSRLTVKVRERILSALREGLRRPDAAARAGIDCGSFLRWMIRGTVQKVGRLADFQRAVREAEKHGRLASITAIVQAAHAGDWATVLDRLDRTFPPVSTEETTTSHLGKALREAHEAARTGLAPSPAGLWHRTWKRLCRDLGGARRPRLLPPLPPHDPKDPALDDYGRRALVRLMTAARAEGA
jgi:hypothetical protein